MEGGGGRGVYAVAFGKEVSEEVLRVKARQRVEKRNLRTGISLIRTPPPSRITIGPQEKASRRILGADVFLIGHSEISGDRLKFPSMTPTTFEIQCQNRPLVKFLDTVIRGKNLGRKQKRIVKYRIECGL